MLGGALNSSGLLFTLFDKENAYSQKKTEIKETIIMDNQQLCDSFHNMDNVVTINITMPQADWDTLRNAEPHGGRCVFDFT